MYIVYGQIQLFLPVSSSLKDKRQTTQSIIARIRKRFNISICEINHHELWQRSAIGFAAACNTMAESDLIIDSIYQTLEHYEDECEVIDLDWDLINDPNEQH